MGSMVLTPGPTNTEKVVWSRNSQGDRRFDIPCTGQRLANRNGVRDDSPPFTCGTYARRAVIKHYLRKTYGGGEKYNQGAKDAVVQAVRALINKTREAWSFSGNFMCTCPNGSATGWDCCTEQSKCSTEPCPCPAGFEVTASVACCDSVCPGLAGAGLMEPFSYLQGSQVAQTLLEGMGSYLQNDIWTSNDPWLLYDPQGGAAYKASWDAAKFDVIDAGIFEAANPVVYYDEARYPFQFTFWEHCTGLLQQVIWTMPLDRATGKPLGMDKPYDPIHGEASIPNVTYAEDFIQTLTLNAYKSSPVYWHYNVRYAPSDSEVCQRKTPRPSLNNTFFPIAGNAGRRLGFSAMTLGGLGGADCYCGWWYTATTCRIPDTLCADLVQILGFSRICIGQTQIYNASDHATVLAALEDLIAQQPATTYPCPSMQISEHWGFINASDGLPYVNATDVILREGASGFRIGNADWLFASQSQILNPSTRVIPPESSSSNVALQCPAAFDASIADHFIDDLFPSAQGVRQSMPQSYCTRYGIELARLTVYKAAGLADAVGQQQGVVDKWKVRCQYKLEELAVCNSFRIFGATGGPQDTSQCPFTLAVAASLKSSYAITPGCLLVLWAAGTQNGIYDPCICVSCSNTPIIDIPAQLTSVCKLESFQTLVGKDVIPGESPDGVPLGSGSFRSLLDKPGFLQINTPDITHWALHTGIRDADRVLDWWPDSWSHPVGYHVTPGCSRPKDAHWKTFDASWRWDSKSEQMVLAKDEVNDPLLSRNALGASGVCRTHNFGMPMPVLNSMAVCTKENAQASADPMVPNPTTPQNWVDGAEYCAKDAFSTPWNVDRTLNAPRQWSVGTLQQDILTPMTATDWGTSCGPYPLRTCVVSSDCAPGLSCIFKGGTGICGKLQPGKFECTTHSQCNHDMMCAGDGICVDGVWQVKNEIPTPVSFRTYSQNCPTGNTLDTWGTSIAELIPDILNASGMCSYRSWFENRRMSDRNYCNTSDTCPAFSGMQPWNFSAPHKQVAGESAFESGILRTQTHPCDRDYQYYANFLSCTPNDNYMAMFDSAGNQISAQQGYARDQRTLTYRVGKRLPLIHHTDEINGPTFGFTGIPKTYADLNLGTAQPSIVSCAGIKVCSLQPKFKVNNLAVDQRLVIDSGEVRGYTIQDLLSCGVFGIWQAKSSTCRLDFAVVPLAYFVLNNPNIFPAIRPKLAEIYTSEKTATLLTVLQQLPGSVLANYIGDAPKTLQDFISQSQLFISLYDSLNQIPKPVYTTAGTPNQLYFITQYGAYEVPFAWWFKCVWIAGFEMGQDPIDESLCTWARTGNESKQIYFGDPDPRLTKLFQMSPTNTQFRQNVTLLSLLLKLPGVVTSDILDQARTEYVSKKGSWMQATYALLQSIQRKCFQQKEYIKTISGQSEEYQLQILAQMYNGPLFDSTKSYYDANNVLLCTGQACLQSTGYSPPVTSNADFAQIVTDAMQNCPVTQNSIPLRGTTVQDMDAIALADLFSSGELQASFWDGILPQFQNLPNGCSAPVTMTTPNSNPTCLCTSWTTCSKKILSDMLLRANIKTSPIPSQLPLLNIATPKMSVGVDVCNDLHQDTVGSCFLNNGTLRSGLNFETVSSMTLPVGVTAETYIEDSWDCIQLACTGNMASMNGLKVSPNFQTYSVTTVERIKIEEYEYNQLIPQFKFNPWPDQATQAAEQLCNDKRNRFTASSSGFDVGPLIHIDEGTSCTDTCSIPRRIASNEQTVHLKTWRISYTVNNSLQIQAELYPCTTNTSIPRALFPSFDQDFPNAPAETVWAPGSNSMADFNRVNKYRSDSSGFQLQQCTSARLPTDLDASKVRTVIQKGSADITAAFKALNLVLSKIDSEITDASCIQTGYCSSMSTSKWTLSIDSWLSSQSQDQCNTLKNDPFFGCMMFPGEMNSPMTQQDFSSSYDCQPSSNFLGSVLSKLGQSTSDSTYLRFGYGACMQNSANDACSSVNPAYRNMRLSGRTLAYELTTVSNDCTKGPLSKCQLIDETQNLDAVMSACPGTNRSNARYVGYSNLNAFHKLNTRIEPPQVFSGDNPLASTVSGGFDHLFLGLAPGYSCCKGCQQTICPDPTQLAVEMRKNLWRCLDCPKVSSVQCKGVHNCLLSSPNIPLESLQSMDGWNQLSTAERSFLTGTDSPIETAASAIKWLVAQISGLWTSDIRLPYAVPKFMTSYVGDYYYNPIPILVYDAAMQINSESCGTDSGMIPDFTNCSYDGHRRTLRQFAQTHYKADDGIVLQPRTTLQWKIRRTQMITQNIPQWEAWTANRSGMFVTDLLDDKWCMTGNMVDNACYVHDEGGQRVIDVLNPGLLGSFEPSVGCDTAVVNQQRVVSAVCGDCASSIEYLQLEDGSMMPCSQTYDAVQRVTLDASAPSSLCSKTPVIDSSSCKNQHGMLGQSTYDGSPVSDIYTRQPWPGGLPVGVSANPLFQGRTPPANTPSNLILSPSDIGGHFVRMVLGQTRSGAYTLSVQGLPLSSYSNALGPAAYSLGVSGSNMLWTQVNTVLETDRLRTLYPNSVCGTWDCPLRRRAFYMGADANFRPVVPDPLRTQVMYGTRAHPTQGAAPMPDLIDQTTSPILGKYVTSNGFCACMSPPCTACAADTIALLGGWTNSSVLRESSQCLEQLDWPYAGGVLRDGSNLGQKWSTLTACGIADRLPTFQYRYTNTKAIQKSQRTTLDKGGVCHMGWPAVTAGPLSGCYILVETDTYMCPTFLQPKNITRLRAKTVDELLGSPTRPRLSDCSPPPTFKFENGTTTVPEVSYGKPKRWEAARLLANDLRRRLCGNSTVCKPTSQWSMPTFWSNVFMANFPAIPEGNGQNPAMWNQPWVACTQDNNGTQTCEGRIDRSDWATGDRPQLCKDALSESSIAKNLAQNINVCDLDSTLDKFCRTVQDARYRVFEANCLYSGQCRQKLFFYQPSTFAVDNNQFVRSTVQNFYNDTLTGSCVPDQDTAAQIQINAQNLDKCAAVQLNVLANCIQIVRAIMSSLVELVFYVGELFLYVFELLGAKNDGAKTQITTRIDALLALIQNKFILLFREIGDLFYKILFEGPMGSWLISIIQAMCNFLEWLFSEVVYVILCLVRSSAIWFLDNIARGVVSILNGVTFGRLGYLQDDITSARASVETHIPCTPQTLWKCNLPFSDQNQTVPTLPLPTRCWAGVEPGVNSLACTAADTCMQSDYSKVICGACPAASSMTRFGCDTLTKLCSCNVFPVGITSCASHEECTMDNNDVSCRYVDSYLQTGFGNVPCSQCPQPICLITDSSGAGGQCSCLLRPVPSQSCSGLGQRVSPDATQLCLVASAGSGQASSSNAYTQDYRTLASAPCMLLNQGQTFCMNVFTSATVSTQLVVGLALLTTGRRRLLWDEMITNGSVFLSTNATMWYAKGEPCHALVHADISKLGILEKHALGECWRWYDVGSRLVVETNMSGIVSPFLLVSWQDMVDTMLDQGALVEIMAKLPAIIHRVFLHSEFIQPLYIMIAYWSPGVPEEIWFNQTVLEQARTFLHNASHSRRLLQQDPVVQPQVIDTTISTETAYEWGQGPYSWPPNFVFWNGDKSCAIASTTLNTIKNGLDATILYYQQPKPDPDPLPWPSLPLKSNITIVGFDLENLTDAWLDTAQVRAFFSEAAYMSTVKGFIQCNFTRIQTCANRHSIIFSALQSACILLLLGAVIKTLGIPYAETVLLSWTVPVFLYVTYGYSPTCFPLIPTCLFSDVYDLLNWLLPPAIVWPDELVTKPNCSSPECMRSCISDPVVGYKTWHDHAAWIMCEADDDWAISTAFTFSVQDPTRTSILRKCVVNTYSMRSAQRICFAVTLINNAPLVAAGFLALWLLPSALAICTAALQFALNSAFMFLLYVHARED